MISNGALSAAGTFISDGMPELITDDIFPDFTFVERRIRVNPHSSLIIIA
jgi:hypothetical protein